MAKKDAATLWDDVREWLTDATRTAIREAEDLTRRGRLKMEIMNLSHRIERKLAELGGVIYQQTKTDPNFPLATDSRVRNLVDRIARLESERSVKQQEYESEKKKR